MKYILTILTVVTVWLNPAFGQNDDSVAVSALDSVWDTFIISEDDAVLKQLDEARTEAYKNSFYPQNRESITVEMDSMPGEANWPQDTMTKRMELLDRATPFDLTYNMYVEAFIKLYVIKKRAVTEKILGVSPYYFPIFEEALDRYELPLELKYLPVVESALNPKARSRVGAMGLWQFMYPTGKMYGLNVTSYYDERMDPYLSTDAACRYLKTLYKQYGDWNLVIAAYNCGPGNVNKAIRRSGGSRDFWELRKWLPRETRGYVPAFHAINYTMNYTAEHGLYARIPDIPVIHTDTVYVCEATTFETISKALNIPVDQLEYYNPMYRLSAVPKSDKGLCLYLPNDAVGLFIMNQDSIYAMENKVAEAKKKEGIPTNDPVPANEIIHKVRSGEVMGLIAQRYGVSVTQLKEWNNLWSSRIYPGQSLKIYSNQKVAVTTAVKKPEPQKTEQEVAGNYNGEFRYYTIQPGDTLWDIAKKYEQVTVADLKKWNSNLNFKKLKPGDKIKISKTS